MSNVIPFRHVDRDAALTLLSAPEDDLHLVHFYEEESLLFDTVAQFLGAGLQAGERVIVIATAEHRSAFVERLGRFDVDAAIADGRILLLDARETLARFMVDGSPERTRFHRAIDETFARVTGGVLGVRVRAYGEMVDLLWRDGMQGAAIALEELWNEARAAHPLSLLCAYVMASFYEGGDGAGYADVCRAHSHVLPAEGSGRGADADVEL